MTPQEKIKSMLPIMQAFADGKTIQSRAYSSQPWTDWNSDGLDDFMVPDFCRSIREYRIKPEPREWHAVLVGKEYPGGWLGSLYATQDEALVGQTSQMRQVIKVREVL